jgi:hypothetical protein
MYSHNDILGLPIHPRSILFFKANNRYARPRIGICLELKNDTQIKIASAVLCPEGEIQQERYYYCTISTCNLINISAIICEEPHLAETHRKLLEIYNKYQDHKHANAF